MHQGRMEKLHCSDHRRRAGTAPRPHGRVSWGVSQPQCDRLRWAPQLRWTGSASDPHANAAAADWRMQHPRLPLSNRFRNPGVIPKCAHSRRWADKRIAFTMKGESWKEKHSSPGQTILNCSKDLITLCSTYTENFWFGGSVACSTGIFWQHCNRKKFFRGISSFTSNSKFSRTL